MFGSPTYSAVAEFPLSVSFPASPTMTEIRECIAHFLLLLSLLRYFKWTPGTLWPLLEIWLDATQAEVANPQHPDASQRKRMAARLPFRLLDASYQPTRGGPAPVSVWPMGITTSAALHRICKLRDVRFSPRALLLDFGERCLSVRSGPPLYHMHDELAQFRFLTHTSVHMYSRQDWGLLKQIPQVRIQTFRVRSL